ncbi:hypothetical protein F5Y19DRAFT_470484 [Xylariaceae sp. FL1651]|nr:hypothetical protein F5Y19DRAFT_470484 [Xylariaceae sp. FL1651]
MKVFFAFDCTITCKVCYQVDNHSSDEYPKRKYHQCTYFGRLTKECTGPNKPKDITCHVCKAMGHLVKDCPRKTEGKQMIGDRGIISNNCGEPGHKVDYSKKTCNPVDKKARF